MNEWLNLFARWFHVFAGILWIGTTYFFTWLDGQLTEEERAATGERAEVWMVHSGGFYVVQKEKKPGTRALHWFRWEAALTWLSGMFLLVLVYYMGGALIDPDVRDTFVKGANGMMGGNINKAFDLSAHYNEFAIVIGIGLLIVAWVVYDLMVQSPLGKNEILFAVISYALVVCVAFSLALVFSGRAVYIHVGAMFGTIMAANVWMRILPAQRRMIAATKEGKTPDANLAARAKLRSKHNTFMVVPLIFTMISNHFPSTTYGEKYNWAILSLLVLLGWGAAKLIRRA
jgi:uncharacterized membrane protein